MFSLYDLPFIGVCVVGVVLGIWGGIAAKKLSGKVVSIITAVAFISPMVGLYIWKAGELTPDYTSKHGVEIVQGKVNKCERATIEEWTGWLIEFWSKHYTPESVKKALKGRRVLCFDTAELTSLGRKVRGVSHGGRTAIGWNGKLSYTRSLFIHELSHHVFDQAGGGVLLGEGAAHKYFAEVKLGH
jgi:hypothetical protein